MDANAFAGPVVVAPGTVSNSDYTQHMRNLHDAGYDPKKDFNANGAIRTQ